MRLRAAKGKKAGGRFIPTRYAFAAFVAMLLWMQLSIGVDGGGSKTRATVFAGERCLGQGRAGPSNPLAVGLETAGSNLVRALDQALTQAKQATGPAWNEEARIPMGLGVAGVGAGERGREAAEALAKFLRARFPLLEPHFYTDLEAAFAGTFEGKAGILVIGGTGSSALGFDGKGQLLRVGGFGKRLGDPGSGFSVLLEAAQLLLSKSEGLLPGGLPPWGLSFLHALSCDDPRDLIPLFARDPSPLELDQGIRILEESASREEAVPRELLRKAGRVLADHAGALGARLALREIPVSCGGGFVSKIPLVREAFCSRLKELSQEQGRVFVFLDRSPDAERGAAGLAVGAWPSLQIADRSR